MPNENMKQVNIAIFVDPSLHEQLEEIAENRDDDCLVLDIERLVGAHLSGCREILRSFRTDVRHSGAEYGESVVEVDQLL